MGDSQNWSSFDDEPAAPKKPSAVSTKKIEQKLVQNEVDAPSVSPLTQPAALRNLRNRLVFGGLVGFVTGATFGGSAYAYQLWLMHTMGGVKTVLSTQRGEDDLINLGVATVAAGLPFVRSTVMKQNVPYALMLVALDHFHEEINELRN
ncbi:hypothetical protein BBJ28_00019904 [Nothophytophthora sp. Chile5]|nr:hypothetical protein BBJ28_00019904 [Nothophytophthora sp. Chile5]